MIPEAPAPKISVIIATYNKSEALYHAIESVLWQTLGDFECWIVGDACTDDSESMVAGFHDQRLKWYNLPQNSGYQSAPNNEGLLRARGEYVAYLNHDDIWLPNHLQILVDFIEQTQADFAYSIVELIRLAGNIADIPNYPEASRPPEASATIHRRDVVDRIGFWKEVHETRAIPRVDFFRRAQFAKMSFVIAPYLTTLKFNRHASGYAYTNQQAVYIERISNEADFAETELASMLIEAYKRLESPPSLKWLRLQLLQGARRALVKRGIEPDSFMPWLKPGQRIDKWRRSHGLDPK